MTTDNSDRENAESNSATADFRHYGVINPETEWSRGFGFFLRLRSLVTSLIFKFAAVIWAFCNQYYQLAAWLFVVGGFVLLGLFAYRRWCLWQCRSYSALHKLCERLRDEISAFDGQESVDPSSKPFTNFCDTVVQAVATFFREFVRDKTVNCAIRISAKQNGSDVYRTMARSPGLNIAFREKHTQDIPADKGIAMSLRKKQERGVWIIRNIKAACEAEIWLQAPSDELSDIKTLLVAPINGFEAKQKVMFGILYVTSMKNPFNWQHVEPMKGIADLLGLVFPLVLDKISTESSTDPKGADLHVAKRPATRRNK